MRPPRSDNYLTPPIMDQRGNRAAHEVLRQAMQERQRSILEHAEYEAFVREARAAGAAPGSAKRSWLTRLRSFLRRRG